MYERFTDRARKSMQLAQQEALRLNHDIIDDFHVLLGLVKEGSGVAANVLKDLDVDLGKVRSEVEKLAPPGCADQVAPGKLPQTPRARRVIENAVKEARDLNHNYVGTEHLLLGLLGESDGLATQVLEACGATAGEVREEVMLILGPTNKPPEASGEPRGETWLTILGAKLEQAPDQVDGIMTPDGEKEFRRLKELHAASTDPPVKFDGTYWQGEACDAAAERQRVLALLDVLLQRCKGTNRTDAACALIELRKALTEEA